MEDGGWRWLGCKCFRFDQGQGQSRWVRFAPVGVGIADWRLRIADWGGGKWVRFARARLMRVDWGSLGDWSAKPQAALGRARGGGGRGGVGGGGGLSRGVC